MKSGAVQRDLPPGVQFKKQYFCEPYSQEKGIRDSHLPARGAIENEFTSQTKTNTKPRTNELSMRLTARLYKSRVKPIQTYLSPPTPYKAPSPSSFTGLSVIAFTHPI